MKAYSCDRCGKLCDLDEGRSTPNVRISVFTNNGFERGRWKDLDICNECAAGLRGWFKSGSKHVGCEAFEF